jgi:hypothetical protein
MDTKLLKKISIIIITVTQLAIILLVGCNTNKLFIKEEDKNNKTVENQEDYALKMDKVEGLPEGNGKVDYNFDLQIREDNEPKEVVAGNFLILYQVENNAKLLLIIESLYPDLVFNGDVKASLLLSGRDILSSENFQFNEFKQNDVFRETISFKPDAEILNLEVNGIFKK